MRLHDKVVMITVASKELGVGMAGACAREGAKVVITARTLPELEPTITRIRAGGGTVEPVQADMSRPAELQALVAQTLANTVSSNGNELGRSSAQNPVFGTHGVILLHDVRRVLLKNITVRQSRPFAVHLANAHEFTVENVTLDQTRRDGVHVNGPASDGLIRGVRGDSHDDNVALNAWEWKNYVASP